eukprot:CAMPEP_0114530484 /NCGR_PEP_ID=MMETSP0109-20121206/25472_1 /TAXON_ID=29199 /ORGANISM="Chlorarachnion reptans, Strain CCCM449" /LENGTH=213 /DNA_ID=CAMNT_0001713115 /DNA_START=315 /DNA_END=956 /DNA_ORIENTATION=+
MAVTISRACLAGDSVDNAISIEHAHPAPGRISVVSEEEPPRCVVQGEVSRVLQHGRTHRAIAGRVNAIPDERGDLAVDMVDLSDHSVRCVRDVDVVRSIQLDPHRITEHRGIGRAVEGFESIPNGLACDNEDLAVRRHTPYSLIERVCHVHELARVDSDSVRAAEANLSGLSVLDSQRLRPGVEHCLAVGEHLPYLMALGLRNVHAGRRALGT